MKILKLWLKGIWLAITILPIMIIIIPISFVDEKVAYNVLTQWIGNIKNEK